MGWQARTSLLLAIALVGACTKDFSRFQFRDLPPVAKSETGGSSGNASKAGRDASPGRNQLGGTPSKAGTSGSQYAGRGGTMRMDGGAGPVAARGGTTAAQAGSGSGRGAPAPNDDDAGMRPDAQMPPDASQPARDAGPTEEQQCATSASRDLADIASGCSACACDACAASVLPCLEKGDVYERPCRDVLSCSVSHGCRDWDCYCLNEACRDDPEAAGDGPCVEEMNAAAGGSLDRAAVNAAHSDKDASNPMTMALKATSCILGSGRGPLTGACETACESR